MSPLYFGILRLAVLRRDLSVVCRFIANLLQSLVFQELSELIRLQGGVSVCQRSKSVERAARNVLCVLFPEEELQDPIVVTFCNNNRPMPVLVQALLENATA